MSKSFLDLLPPERAKATLERAQRRLERDSSKEGLDISPEMFLVAEMGYHFGWEAVLAVRRGFTIIPTTKVTKNKAGEKIYQTVYEKETFTLEEAEILREGAKKVFFSKLIDQAHAGMVSNSFKTQATSFEKAVSDFREKSKVKE